MGGFGQPVGEASALLGAPTSISNLQNGQVLTYNAATNTWQNQSPAAGGVSSLASANSGLTLNASTGAVTITLGELSQGTLGGKPISISSLATGQVLQWNGTDWVNATPTSGVSSVSNSDGTLTISPTTGAVVASLALGNPNTWSGLQTFGSNLSFLGAQVSGSLTSGGLLLYNGSNWIDSPTLTYASPTLTLGGTSATIILTGGSTGTTALATANTSSSSYTATLPANTGTLAELNLAQSWSGLQTFGANLSFLGATVSGSLTSGGVLVYNGTNWVDSSTLTYASPTLTLGGASATLKMLGSSTGYTSLATANASSTSYTATLPANTGTVAELNLGQTWTALQQFTNGDFAILGSSTGYTILQSGLSGASNNTLTLPTTASDTLAAIGTAQTWSAEQTFAATSTAVLVQTGSSGVAGVLIQNSGTGTALIITPNSTSAGLTNTAILTGYGTTSISTAYFELTVGGVVTEYNGISGVGVNSTALTFEVLSTTTSPVVLTTTSGTVIDSYTPTAAGLFLVYVSISCKTGATITSLTVTYTDHTTGTTNTVTLATSVSCTADDTYSYSCLVCATTAAAIKVIGYASAGSDLYASVLILGA